MKKLQFYAILRIVLFLLLAISCNNQTDRTDEPITNLVSESKALQISKIIALDNSKVSNKNITNRTQEIKECKPIYDENNNPLFYITNYEGGGFVIVSADDRIAPILAYSDKNNFRTNAKEYSTGLIEWLSLTKEGIQSIRKRNIKQSNIVKKQWDDLSTGRVPDDTHNCVDSVEEVGPLLSTLWHQGCGFNDYMPQINCTNLPCGKAYAGCVPIAIAQVMKYHQYPSNYNWNDMPNSYGTNSTAVLIRDIHSKIGTISYKCDGTGVDKDYNFAGVFTRFGYSTASQGSYNYQTVMQQLRWNRPVILSGGRKSGWWIFSSYEEGHMWVCDGFRQTQIYSEDCSMGWGYLSLHMNWGWENGYENGWYNFDNFNPSDFTFNYQTKMVYNINP